MSATRVQSKVQNAGGQGVGRGYGSAKALPTPLPQPATAADSVQSADGVQSTVQPTSVVPNPGSDAALERGCLCPVFDNAHGAGLFVEGGRAWWRSDDCPLHAA